MKTIFTIIVTLFLASCNTHKDLTKSKVEEKIDTSINTVETKTVTEKLDTLITFKADTVTGTSFDLDNDPIIEFKDGIKLIVSKDPITKKVTAQAIKLPNKIHLKIDKVTVDNKKENKTIAVKTFTQNSHLDKTVTRGLNFNYLWWLLLLLLIPIWKYRKYLF